VRKSSAVAIAKETEAIADAMRDVRKSSAVAKAIADAMRGVREHGKYGETIYLVITKTLYALCPMLIAHRPTLSAEALAKEDALCFSSGILRLSLSTSLV
jgi:hypothetical protein